MAYNLLLGGAAGQGIETTASILEKLLKRSGCHLFTTRDFMSRIRGGHNFTQIRFGDQPLFSHADPLDCVVALDAPTAALHTDRLLPDGVLLCDETVESSDAHALRLALTATARELGNPRFAGSVAAGAALRLFGFGFEEPAVREVLGAYLRPELADGNTVAFRRGYDMAEERFKPLSGDASGHMLVTGSQTMALGALASGLRFYAAYPMSPSTPILEYLASKSLEAGGVVVEQAEDEIAAINLAIGASYAGVRAMTATSGGGFSLMVEALGLAGITEIPLVVADIQRPGPATGLPTRTEQADLQFVLTASQGEFPRAVLSVRSHRDIWHQTRRAFELADRYQLPVILLGDQYLGDASATMPVPEVLPVRLPAEAMEEALSQGVVSVSEDRPYQRYEITKSGVSPRLLPGKSPHLVIVDSDEHDEEGLITESADMRRAMVDKRARKSEGLAARMEEPDWIGPTLEGEPVPTELLLLGWGSLWGPLHEAVELLTAAGRSAGALVWGDLYPFPAARLTALAASAQKVVNVEQNSTGQLARLIRQETGLACHASILRYDGRQLSGDQIADRIQKEVSE
jgi:2-oxoglutarate ferredoxin oxidoreductase subunit alpha